jgi:nicotinamide-nucleotide amidase
MTTDPESSEDPDDVQRLSAIARRAGMSVAVAESLTSGVIASRLGAGENAADWFAGGVVAYQTRTKIRVLGLRSEVDPCSAECAETLAGGVRDLLRSDIAVSATGVGGPDPEDGHPPGTVHLGWATAASVGSRLHRFDGDPASVLSQTADAAIALLLELVRASTDSTPEPA